MKPWKAADLEGNGVRLSALRADEEQEIWEATAGEAERIWRWYTVRVHSLEDYSAFHANLLREAAAGTFLAWTIRTTEASPGIAAGAVVGGTSFLNISQKDARVELGSTWITPACQGTHVNVAAKLLLLDYAFDVLGCQRVELKTDGLNAVSRAAMLALGATYEGTFRAHMLTWEGRSRNTAWFSFIRDEWAEKRLAIVERLRAKREANLR